jgi:hypothetical protein
MACSFPSRTAASRLQQMVQDVNRDHQTMKEAIIPGIVSIYRSLATRSVFTCIVSTG